MRSPERGAGPVERRRPGGGRGGQAPEWRVQAADRECAHGRCHRLSAVPPGERARPPRGGRQRSRG
ncbi:hypothetical protein ADK38_47675, partial [Streptomyces varsoviensis]